MSHPHAAGRETALQYLYTADVLDWKDVQPFETYVKALPGEEDYPLPGKVLAPGTLPGMREPLSPEGVAYAKKIVGNVLTHREELDAEISRVAVNWQLNRMSTVDRNILRVGLAELAACPETSHKIVINEAVELAKRYSSDEAGAFVNGLLDKLRPTLRPE